VCVVVVDLAVPSAIGMIDVVLDVVHMVRYSAHHHSIRHAPAGCLRHMRRTVHHIDRVGSRPVGEDRRNLGDAEGQSLGLVVDMTVVEDSPVVGDMIVEHNLAEHNLAEGNLAEDSRMSNLVLGIGRTRGEGCRQDRRKSRKVRT